MIRKKERRKTFGAPSRHIRLLHRGGAPPHPRQDHRSRCRLAAPSWVYPATASFGKREARDPTVPTCKLSVPFGSGSRSGSKTPCMYLSKRHLCSLMFDPFLQLVAFSYFSSSGAKNSSWKSETHFEGSIPDIGADGCRDRSC